MCVCIPETINIVKVQAFPLTFKSYLVPRTSVVVGRCASSSIFSKWQSEKCPFSRILFSPLLSLSIMVLIFIYIVAFL